MPSADRKFWLEREAGTPIPLIRDEFHAPSRRSASGATMKSDATLIPVRGEIGYIPKPGRKITDLFHNGSSGRDKTAREGHCRMCQKPRHLCAVGDQPATLTRHHLVPLRWFVRDGARYRAVRNANANIVPLCWPCHKLIEDKDIFARRMLRRVLTQREIAFAVQLRGIQWLDRAYPLR